MFGKLKDKLKGALSVFSKKAEEEAEEQVQDVVEETEEVPERTAEEKVEVEEPMEGKEEVTEEPEILEEKRDEEEKPSVETTPTAEDLIKQTKQRFAKPKPKPKKVKPPFAEKLVEDEIVKEKEEAEKQREIKEKLFKKEEKAEKEKAERKEERSEEKEEVSSVEEEKEAQAEQPVEEEKPEVEQVKEEKAKGFFGKLKKSIFGAKEDKEEKVEEEPEPVEEEEKKEAVKVEEKKAEPKEEKQKEEKKTFFGKVAKTITTKKISAGKFESLFWNLELALLENNVSVEVIEKIKEDLKEELVDKPLPRNVPKKIGETLQKTLQEILSHEKVNLLQKVRASRKSEKPFVIAFFGINGSGKTTSIAKLTHYFQQNNLSVVLAACDTFRAAAIQQLQEHADKLNVKMIKHNYGSDAAAVAFDAIKYAEKNKIDVVMIDTAGRLHSNVNLMAELEKIIRVTNPDLKLFVGESITGNDCIEQARKFNDLVEMDGTILTKADVDEKGGAPLSISYVIKKPILFLGVGQKYEDLEEFDKDVILGRLGVLNSKD